MNDVFVRYGLPQTGSSTSARPRSPAVSAAMVHRTGGAAGKPLSACRTRTAGRTREADTASILYVDGESLRGSTYEEEFERIRRSAGGSVIVDVSRMSTMDTAAVVKILDLWERLFTEGRQLLIRGCTEEVYSVFKYLKICAILPVERKHPEGRPRSSPGRV